MMTMRKKSAALFGAALLGSAASFMTVPSASFGQLWDYDYYDGYYNGRYGPSWFYDYYTPRFNERYRHEDWRWKSDWELKEDVESELTWSPFVDADDIDVSVKNGEVTLKGQVEDKSAVHDAIENAYEAGAKKVISKLKTEESQD